MPILTDTRTKNAKEVEARILAGKRLVPIAVPIRLKRDEHCLFAEQSEWFPEPRRPRNTTTDSPNVGVLYITNQRVLFKARKRSRILSASEIDQAEDSKRGVVVYKTNDKADFFRLRRNKARVVTLLIDTLAGGGFHRADIVAYVLRKHSASRFGDDDIL